MNYAETTTVTELHPVAWYDALGPGHAELTRLIEAHLEHLRLQIEGLRPGSPSDEFQRLAGQANALRWVLDQPRVARRKSQKPKPGDTA